MYQLYIIDEEAFDPKKLVTESSSMDMIRARLTREFAKDSETKYIIEETTGHVDSYGNLVPQVVEEN